MKKVRTCATTGDLTGVTILSCLFESISLAHYLTWYNSELSNHLWKRVVACSTVLYVDTFTLRRYRLITLITMLEDTKALPWQTLILILITFCTSFILIGLTFTTIRVLGLRYDEQPKKSTLLGFLYLPGPLIHQFSVYNGRIESDLLACSICVGVCFAD